MCDCLLFSNNKNIKKQKQTFMIAEFPFYRQMGELDFGIACLRMITEYFGIKIPKKELYSKIQTNEHGISLAEISDVAKDLGMETLGVRIKYERLADDIPTPCIAYWREQHFIVVYKVTERFVYVADPATKGLFIISKSAFMHGWVGKNKMKEGVLLLLETTPAFYEKAKHYASQLVSVGS